MKCDTPDCDDAATTSVTVIITGSRPVALALCDAHTRDVQASALDGIAVVIVPLTVDAGAR